MPRNLYDRLRDGNATPVRAHLQAGLDYQGRLARFLENHDEPRAAATFAAPVHEAAALITYLTPGLRFFHQGQFEDRRMRISPHLVRAPIEPTDAVLQAFYERLLALLRQPVLRDGEWRLLDTVAAWDGNWTDACFIAWAWQGSDGQRRIVVVNFADHPSQCYLHLPFADLAGRRVRLQDQMGPAVYDRDGNELLSRGLYLDLPPWGCHVFAVADPGSGAGR